MRTASSAASVPQIAQTIVHLGVDLQGVVTRATLADTLALALNAQACRSPQLTKLKPRPPHERIPILQMGKFLLVSIQVDLHDQMALQLQDDLTAKIEKTGARGVLIDISALELVDSFIGRMIADISVMSGLMNAQTILVGMQPAVAITLVELGLTLAGVKTALNVEQGMRWLNQASGEGAMSVTKSEMMPLRSEQDVVLARQAVRKITQEAGFTLVDQTKMVPLPANSHAMP